MVITVIEDSGIRVKYPNGRAWRVDDEGRLEILDDDGKPVMVYLSGEWRSVAWMRTGQ